eukprot:Pompholyxophrys_sp_v1_NODE_102_length_1985_cov_3.586528.p1 type:complete len:221 gc:universal NODE_102_length_1985_cov_3.586528:1494-832(-)
MNVQYGGKQKVVHDSILTEDCLGSEPAVMKFNGAILDKKLKSGDKQSMIFLPGDPPPFYFLDCPTHDQVNCKKPKKQLSKSALKKRDEQILKVQASAQATKQLLQTSLNPALSSLKEVVENLEDSISAVDVIKLTEVDNIVEGYIGKCKGKKQILWERGLWKAGMARHKTAKTQRSTWMLFCRIVGTLKRADCFTGFMHRTWSHIIDVCKISPRNGGSWN